MSSFFWFQKQCINQYCDLVFHQILSERFDWHIPRFPQDAWTVLFWEASRHGTGKIQGKSCLTRVAASFSYLVLRRFSLFHQRTSWRYSRSFHILLVFLWDHQNETFSSLTVQTTTLRLFNSIVFQAKKRKKTKRKRSRGSTQSGMLVAFPVPSLNEI